MSDGLHDCISCGKEDSETINGCDLCFECGQRLRPAMDALDALSQEDRKSVFAGYCTHCGSEDVGCQCWNDE